MLKFGDTALIYASTFGQMALLEYLIQRGADIHTQNKVNSIFNFSIHTMTQVIE